MGARLFTLSSVPQGGAKINRRRPGAEPPRPVRGGPRVDGGDHGSAGAVRDADRRRTRDRPPQDCGGTGVFSERRGFSGGGTRRAAATTNENGRRAVAPSKGAPATERGWVFPRPMIRFGRGRLGMGAPGENQGGGNRSPPPPRRAKIKPTGRASRREAARGTTARPQPRRERDNASSRWRGPWARLNPREARPRGRAALFSPRLQNRLKRSEKQHFQVENANNRPKIAILRHFSVIFALKTLIITFLTTSKGMKCQKH